MAKIVKKLSNKQKKYYRDIADNTFIEVKEIVTGTPPFFYIGSDNIYHQVVSNPNKIHKGYWRDCKECISNL